MSHFTVLVIGDNVDEQLAPFHEFECTGEDDQYVQDIDKTEEARKEFEKRKETRYRRPDGTITSAFTKEGEYKKVFLREPTAEEKKEIGPLAGSGSGRNLHWTSHDWKDGKGYRTMIVETPKGWTEIEVPASEVLTFAEFIEDWYGHKAVPFGQEPDKKDKHKYGYTLLDANGEVLKTVDRTNPNKKWDWYQIGGRWNGFFKLKAGNMGVSISEVGAPLLDNGNTGIIGTPGLNRMDDGYETPGSNRADQARKEQIDFEGMRSEAGDEAAKRYDEYTRITAGCAPYIPWKTVLKEHGAPAIYFNDEVVDEEDDAQETQESTNGTATATALAPAAKFDIEVARNAYHSQPVKLALRKSDNRDAIWWDPADFQMSREAYIENARNYAIITYAMVKDGEWIQRGEMGWFGITHDETMTKEDWAKQYNIMIDALPGNTLLSVVDCHI